MSAKKLWSSDYIKYKLVVTIAPFQWEDLGTDTRKWTQNVFLLFEKKKKQNDDGWLTQQAYFLDVSCGFSKSLAVCYPALQGLCVISFVSDVTTASQQADNATLQPPATNPCKKKTPFILISPTSSLFACDFHMGSSRGLWLSAALILDLQAGFYQLIRWYLTHQFDQTVRRVCAASAVKSTAHWWVWVFLLFP